MSGMHFERMAGEYATARPPYPAALYRALADAGVIGKGRQVLEIGAGAGLATVELIRAGCDVVALEPGVQLTTQLRAVAPTANVIQTALEDADLPETAFDAAVAATSLHWVDLAVGLPKIRSALRSDGRLAVWRTVFGDDSVETEFRRRVAAIVAARSTAGPARRSEPRPSMEELAQGGWFMPESSEEWRWSINLTADQVHRLFRTFSNWTPAEADAAAQAATDLGGEVTEHYRTVLHLLRVTHGSDAAGRHDA